MIVGRTSLFWMKLWLVFSLQSRNKAPKASNGKKKCQCLSLKKR